MDLNGNKINPWNIYDDLDILLQNLGEMLSTKSSANFPRNNEEKMYINLLT